MRVFIVFTMVNLALNLSLGHDWSSGKEKKELKKERIKLMNESAFFPT